MKISIVTPTYNRTTFLNETIESIVTQKGDFELEYIIQDGGSDQKLIYILEQWDQKIKNKEIEIKCKKLTFNYFIENDNGMYDAINKGFEKSSGDIMAWLNSDDVYHPGALQSVMKIFKKFDTAEWLTGEANNTNCDGACCTYDGYIKAYSQKFINHGYHRMENNNYRFNFIQQESTFWRRSLWERAGAKINEKNKYAGDFYLWENFSDYTDLVKVDCLLGTFRIHGEQFTSNIALYIAELPQYQKPPMNLRIFITVLQWFPKIHRLFFSKYTRKFILIFFGLHFKDFLGRTITWSFSNNSWVLQKKTIL